MSSKWRKIISFVLVTPLHVLAACVTGKIITGRFFPSASFVLITTVFYAINGFILYVLSDYLLRRFSRKNTPAGDDDSASRHSTVIF